MDGSERYYAKLNKSGRERQTLHDYTYMWNKKKKEQKKQKVNRLTDTNRWLPEGRVRVVGKRGERD